MLQQIYDAINPVAFTLGPLSVRWYGIAYLLGFLLGALIIWKVARHWRIEISSDDVLTVLIGIVLGAILGGRLGYVLFYGDGYYLAHPQEILMLSNGGMSFHGGFIGIVIGGLISARITHVPFLTLADLGAIAAPVGLFFGRCANFINGELWGAPTDLPWGVVFGGAAGSMPRHPSQLYEALLEGVVLFIVLFALSRKFPPRHRGTFFGIFLVLYGTFRIMVEFIREPDVQLGYLFGGWLTMGMVLSIPLILIGIVLLVFTARRALPQMGDARLALDDATPLAPSAEEGSDEEVSDPSAASKGDGGH